MKTPRRQLQAFCLVGLLSVGVFIVFDTIGEVRRGLAAVDAELLGRAHLLTEHAHLFFRGVDTLLIGLAGSMGRVSPSLLEQDQRLTDGLQRALDYVPQLTALALVDSAGNELFWTGEPRAAELNMSVADIVGRHGAAEDHHIGSLVKEHRSGCAFIPVSAPLASADGEFQGFALALVDVESFHDYHRQLDPAGAWRAGVFLSESRSVVALTPDTRDDDGRRTGLPALQKIYSGDCTIEPSPIDGSLRMSVYKELDDYPIGVSVSIRYWDVAADFYGLCLRRLLLLLGLALATRVFYKALSRSMDTAEQLREKRLEMFQQQSRFEQLSREIIQHIPNGRVALVNPDLRYLYAAGRAFKQHERLAPARIFGKTIREVHLPDVADALEKLAESALEGTESTAEMELADGLYYEVTAVPLRDDRERVDRVLLLSQDVTAFHRARQTLEARNQELHEISFTDSLLGISNRRALDEQLEREWTRAQRHGHSLSILMIDVDHFKIFNDTYGHAAGDKCLRQIASAIGEAVFRPGDLVARYGGEEIAVLLPETNEEGALEVAERIHSALAHCAIPFPHSPISDHVTLSIGVASVSPESDEQAGSVVQLADTALYRAKQKGRNRTVVSRVAETATLTEA